jgi:SAM-dependent methyltransferase
MRASVGGMREEGLNVELAKALASQGLVALPEQRLPDALPDVLVIFNGLRLCLEGKVADQKQAEHLVWRKARERVDRGIAHLAVALLYPPELRHVAPPQLPDALKRSRLRFSVCEPFTEQAQWQEGDLSVLTATLQLAYQRLASEDEVTKAVDILRDGVMELSREFLLAGVSAERVAEPLGIDPTTIADVDKSRRNAVTQIAALVLLNALLFQEELARCDHRVKNLAQCLDAPSPHDELLQVWKFILRDINYHAIFDIACEILQTLPPDKRLDEALRRCAEKVREIVRLRVTLRHDLAGRIYHRLLGDIAKPLGAFYTSVSAATLLMHLALNPRWWQLDWSDENAVAKLTIADLACGTGTLLMAAAHAVIHNFLLAANHTTSVGLHWEELAQRRQRLLKQLLENGIWGMDVLPSAVHLTATTLALPIPEVMVKGMHLYVLPLGISKDGTVHLGSLDFLHGEPIPATLSLFPPPHRQGRRVTDRTRSTVSIQLCSHSMDLVCMNPPFTRSCGDNLLFGSLPKEEREKLQKALQRLIAQKALKASATAGLGSVFVALADQVVKPGGHLAFVLPKGLLSGVEWAKTRQLLTDRYHLLALIVSHDPNRWNFSENTDLSEVLLIASRNPIGVQRVDDRFPSPITLCVNLWHNPTDPLKALLLAEQLRELSDAQPDTIYDLWLGNEKAGETVIVRWSDLRALPHWLFPFAFAQGELVMTLLQLYRDGVFNENYLPLCPLQQLGELGPDVRDIYDGFEILEDTSTPTNYPAFWGHDAETVTTLHQSPNAYLAPLRHPRPKRPLRDAELLWSRAGKVLIAERMRTEHPTTNRCSAT